MSVIGFDTSNYTTSIAVYSLQNSKNYSKLLPVKQGELGLRQSDAVFHHTKGLPELSDRLFSDFKIEEVECSHQQGHIAAALWSAGRLDLMDTPHLAWHLSGGTTELLLVEPEGKNVKCTKIGGTTDISAGQLIDRTGQLLGLPFPSGKHLDALSTESESTELFRIKCNGTEFSLSGMENKVNQYHLSKDESAQTAAYALRSIADVILRATVNAQKEHHLPVVCSGGVASNSLLRKVLSPLEPIFAQPSYSTDNAMGVAIIASRMQED